MFESKQGSLEVIREHHYATFLNTIYSGIYLT